MGVPHRPEGCSGPLGARPPARPPSGGLRADHERGDRRRIAARAYNGIALRYAEGVLASLARTGDPLPLCIVGRLNQIPEDSNSGLPVDVTREIDALGAVPCPTPEAVVAAPDALASEATVDDRER